MNAAQRRTYWTKTERARAKVERKYTVLLRDMFNEQGRSLIIAIDRHGYQAVYTLPVEPWSEELAGIYTALFTEAFTQAASATYNTMSRVAQVKKDVALGGMGRSEQWALFVQDWLRREGLQKITTISGNSKELLIRLANEAIQAGINQGMGGREIAALVKDAIADKWEGYSAYRALRIARTESNTAANLGHMEGAKSLPFYADKVWISAKDSRTRKHADGDNWDHWVMDGQQVAYELPFIATSLMGGTLEVAQPGDPDAPPGFVINCRCRVAFEAKRDKDGRLLMKPKPGQGAPATPRAPRPTPVSTPAPQTETFMPGKNLTETKRLLKEWIEKQSGLRIGSVAVSSGLTKDQFNRRAEMVAKLFKEYNLDPATAIAAQRSTPTKLEFKSTGSYHGVVRTYLDGGKASINFGHTTDGTGERGWIAGSAVRRDKSAVDDANTDLATTVHEFAHVMAVSAVQRNEETKVYFLALGKIRDKYRTEITAGSLLDGQAGVNDIDLGRYADTNINEFMAEAWTEYKLKTNPSKYAKEVGQLIDRFFKKGP
jgi:hypothetical protein